MQNHGGPRFGTSGKTCVSKSDKDVKRKVTWQRQLSTGETFSAWGQPFFPSTVLGQQVVDHVQASLDEVVAGAQSGTVFPYLLLGKDEFWPFSRKCYLNKSNPTEPIPHF